MIECLDQCDVVLKACDIIGKLKRQTELASKYRRHKFYAGTQEEHGNVYSSAKYALGATDLSINLPAPSSDDHLLSALSLKQLIYKTSNIVQPLLHSESHCAKVESMKGMANVVYLETMHYTKHLMRGWWQEHKEAKIKEN